MRFLSNVGLWTGLVCALGGPAEAAKKPVTLDAVMEESSRGMRGGAGSPLWAPDGERFVHRRGSKLFLYTLKGKESKELLDTATLGKEAIPAPLPRENDWVNRRYREQATQWSPDGKRLLLLVKGDLFLYDLASNKTEPLVRSSFDEHDPKFSPDGKSVGFRRDHDLYVIDLTSRKELRLTTDGSERLRNGEPDWVYPEELDLGTAWWWSPDSTQIAYMQFDVSREWLYPQSDHLQMQAVSEPERYPKAGSPNADVRVGVIPATGGLTRWMNFGETRDHLTARVHWTPDSRSLYILKMNRIQNHLEIWRNQVNDGAGQVVMEEKDPYWINLNDDFEILSDGRILRSSEQTGYRHLWVTDASGKNPRPLTSGEWEVKSIACVDEKTKRAFYVSTETAATDRQLWAIGLDGSGKTRITKGEGAHAVNMNPGCTAFLDSFSNVETPTGSTLRRVDGAEIAVWQEPNRKVASEYDIQKTEISTFKGPDGTLFYARLIKPAGFDPSKKYPAVVMVYGGPQAQSVVNTWPGLSWEQVLAAKGFVIWQVDNRGSAGRGHAFESPVYRRLGKVEVEDQKTGVQHLLSMGFVDPKKIGVYGWSYGGYMTLSCMLHAPEVFHAGAAGAPVTHWRNYDTIYTERYMGLPQENEKSYDESSPVTAAANLQGKLLLIHNLEDDNVLFGNSVQMLNALEEANKPFQLLYYPQKAHGVSGPVRRHLYDQIIRFFEESLK